MRSPGLRLVLVLGGLEIYDTPGHHGAIVREPRSQVLAEQLTDALSKVEVQAKVVPPGEPERELVEVGS